MAYQLATAFVRIAAVGAKGLLGVFNKLKNYAISTFKSISGMLLKIGLLAGGISFAGMLKLAGDAEELESKFQAIFQNGTEAASKWAEDFALKAGRSIGDIKNQMATFAGVFIPIGFGRDEATEFSKNLTTMAQDLASFHNKSEQQAVAALRGALTGEREMLKQFNIVVYEEDVKNELAARGQAKLTGETLKRAKALATLDIIRRKSATAEGDAIKTAGSFTNRMRGLRGAIKDITGDIGQAFTPALANLAGHLTNLIRKIAPFVQKWAKYIGDAGRAMTMTTQTTWEYVKRITEIAMSGLYDLFMQIPEMFGYAMGLTARVAWEGLKLIYNGFKAIIVGFMKWHEAQWLQTFENISARAMGRKPVNVRGGWLNEFEMFDIFSGKLSKMGGSIAKGFRMENPFGGFGMEFSEHTKDLIDDFRDELDKDMRNLPKDPESKKGEQEEIKAKTITVKDFKLPTGFIDFKDASVKIQESLLKNADPQRQQVVELKRGNRLAQDLLLTMKKVESNTAKAANGGGGGTAVATE